MRLTQTRSGLGTKWTLPRILQVCLIPLPVKGMDGAVVDQPGLCSQDCRPVSRSRLPVAAESSRPNRLSQPPKSLFLQYRKCRPFQASRKPRTRRPALAPKLPVRQEVPPLPPRRLEVAQRLGHPPAQLRARGKTSLPFLLRENNQVEQLQRCCVSSESRSISNPWESQAKVEISVSHLKKLRDVLQT